MELVLKRNQRSEHSTIGILYVDNKSECYTLEDKERPVKVKAETAIPIGEYEVVLTFSNRFKRVMPLLLNVPGFEGIRIHSGNTNHDTEGCILVGQTKSVDYISKSRLAFNALYKKLEVAFNKKEKITIKIVQDYK